MKLLIEHTLEWLEIAAVIALIAAALLFTSPLWGPLIAVRRLR